MAGGGGKGGKSETRIDPNLQAAAGDALNLASAGAAIPYTPNRGLQIAAFTPQQEAAHASADVAAGAFGMPTGGAPSMPPVETVNGIRGYSTGEMYDDTVNKSVDPNLQKAIADLFYNPQTNTKGPSGALYSNKYNRPIPSGGK